MDAGISDATAPSVGEQVRMCGVTRIDSTPLPRLKTHSTPGVFASAPSRLLEAISLTIAELFCRLARAEH